MTCKLQTDFFQIGNRKNAEYCRGHKGVGKCRVEKGGVKGVYVQDLADGFIDARTEIISKQVFSEMAVNDEIAAKFIPPIFDKETVISRISGLGVRDVRQVV